MTFVMRLLSYLHARYDENNFTFPFFADVHEFTFNDHPCSSVALAKTQTGSKFSNN